MAGVAAVEHCFHFDPRLWGANTEIMTAYMLSVNQMPSPKTAGRDAFIEHCIKHLNEWVPLVVHSVSVFGTFALT